MTKTTTPINPIAPNTNVTIEITISNPGEAEATGVVLTESLPGLPGLVATAIAAPAGVCNNADPISPDGATVTCELGDLASKDTITINITASAAAAGTYVAESSLTTTTDGLTPPPPVTAEIIIEVSLGVGGWRAGGSSESRPAKLQRLSVPALLTHVWGEQAAAAWLASLASQPCLCVPCSRKPAVLLPAPLPSRCPQDAPGVPALNISKTVAPGEVLVGEPFTYTITVRGGGTGRTSLVPGAARCSYWRASA